MHSSAPFEAFFFPVFWGLFGLSFWLIPTLLRHRARMKALEMSQRLLEKGVEPPAELLEALKPAPRRPSSPQDDLRRGVIALATACGMMILGVVLQLGGHDDGPVHPLFGVAAFPGLIGLALIALWWFNPRRRDPS